MTPIAIKLRINPKAQAVSSGTTRDCMVPVGSAFAAPDCGPSPSAELYFASAPVPTSSNESPLRSISSVESPSDSAIRRPSSGPSTLMAVAHASAAMQFSATTETEASE